MDWAVDCAVSAAVAQAVVHAGVLLAAEASSAAPLVAADAAIGGAEMRWL